MKISTAKTEVFHLSRNSDQWVVQLNRATLKQIEKFKYLGLHSRVTKAKRRNGYSNCHCLCSNASFALFGFHEQELSKEIKLSICSILTYSLESWVITKRVRSHDQETEMRLLQKIEEVTQNKVRSSKIRKSFKIKSLLLWIKRSQLRWFGHVNRML